MVSIRTYFPFLQRAYGVRTVKRRSPLTPWKSVFMHHFPCVIATNKLTEKMKGAYTPVAIATTSIVGSSLAVSMHRHMLIETCKSANVLVGLTYVPSPKNRWICPWCTMVC